MRQTPQTIAKLTALDLTGKKLTLRLIVHGIVVGHCLLHGIYHYVIIAHA